MEAQGGAEVRRLHIIYFLSRKGRIEQPHLITVQHLSRNGVYLRDVKMWLSELRGKEMPESFAWSYKRKYKTGYVWQDLVDEDLITPVSDNEYVLKGSENSPPTSFHNDNLGLGPLSQNKVSTTHKENRQTTIDFATRTLSEIEEESPDSSMLTDGEKNNNNDELENVYTRLLSRENDKKRNQKSGLEGGETSISMSPASFEKSKSRRYSTNMFKNLMSCGAVETKDTVMVMTNRKSSRGHVSDRDNGKLDRICKGDVKVGGSDRIFGTPWNQQHDARRKNSDEVKDSEKHRKSDEFSNPKKVCVAYKPVNRPNCSQCGKTFNPEKLHSHMKSCRGMKGSSKSGIHASAVEKTQPSQDCVSGYYLTNN